MHELLPPKVTDVRTCVFVCVFVSLCVCVCVCVRARCRYWLFSDVVPGLYVEKGWVHDSIEYNFTLPPEDQPAPEEDEEEQDAEGEWDISPICSL